MGTLFTSGGEKKKIFFFPLFHTLSSFNFPAVSNKGPSIFLLDHHCLWGLLGWSLWSKSFPVFGKASEVSLKGAIDCN